MQIPAASTATIEDEEEQVKEEVKKVIPPQGSIEWIQYCSESEGHLPTPIDVSITGSLVYHCPELKWFNFDVYPHKVKLTNTGYTLLIGAKWKAERPYIEGGPFLEKHILSQIHFHWGANLMEGSDHTVDKRRYPGEMQVTLLLATRHVLVYFLPTSKKEEVTFFRKEYMTQEEALRHPDGVAMVCYIIKHGVNPDDRLSWVIEGFPRVQEAQTSTRIGPCPMSRLLPMFSEDYFLYWGSLTTVRGESHVVKWIVPRTTLFASMAQMKQFRKVWDPWDERNLRNYRPLQERGGRTVFFISPHWSQYNSLLPIPRVPEASISTLSPCYQANMHLLPPQNAYMLPQPKDETEQNKEM